jgi:DNA-binding CsgD family transcriptional regulator
LTIVSAELLARAGRVAEAEHELSTWEQQATAPYLMRELWHARAKAAIAIAAHDDRRALALLGPYSEALEGAGLLVDLLWARLDLGRVLAGIDRQRAIEAFTQAAELAGRIGAASQARLAGQALRSLGVRAWRRGRATRGDRLDALSEREREVTQLVAEGQSNREIAEALLVSPKTVERHLTNVLAKLGLRNRTELAALVHSAVRGSPDE